MQYVQTKPTNLTVVRFTILRNSADKNRKNQFYLLFHDTDVWTMISIDNSHFVLHPNLSQCFIPYVNKLPYIQK